MTRRERLERKAERREEWANSREAKSNEAFKRTDLSESATGIPFGQPILVGHHSEGAHRRVIARAESAMRAGVEHSNMASHHHYKAAGIRSQLDRSIFSDDENAIQAIEDRIAGREQERAKNNAINKIIRRKPKNESTPEKIEELGALGISEATATLLLEPDFCGRVGIPSYVNQNLGGNISSDRKRLAGLKVQLERKEAAEETDEGVTVTNSNGWCIVTFAEKPDYSIIKELKDSGFRWSGGSWRGTLESLPDGLRNSEA
jgi:hypothetical protein